MNKQLFNRVADIAKEQPRVELASFENEKEKFKQKAKQIFNEVDNTTAKYRDAVDEIRSLKKEIVVARKMMEDLEMKANKAIIGGEGNGGIIYPESHYGRDSLVGTALFLMLMAERGGSVSALRKSYPAYFMSKKKIQLTPELNVDEVLLQMAEKYKEEDHSTIDGVKIDFANSWVHLRKSNTEPIIRIYTEAPSQAEADDLANKVIKEIEEITSPM